MNEKITVCSKCFRASCIQGYFLCEENTATGTTEKTISELMILNLESSDYWESEQKQFTEEGNDFRQFE